MRIGFDLDGVLCTGYPYEQCKPILGARECLQGLRSLGHQVIIYTARGMGSGHSSLGLALKKVGALTFRQLDEWEFEYDEIFFGKPDIDIFIDDKAYHFDTQQDIVTQIMKILTACDCEE